MFYVETMHDLKLNANKHFVHILGNKCRKLNDAHEYEHDDHVCDLSNK